MTRYRLIASGVNTWTLHRDIEVRVLRSGLEEMRPSVSSVSVRKSNAYPELWLFQAAGDSQLIPIIALDQIDACMKYLRLTEEIDIRRHQVLEHLPDT